MALIPEPQFLLTEIQQLQAAGNHESMLAKVQQAMQAFPEQDHFRELYHYAQAHYVDEKLHSKIVQQLIAQKDHVQLYKIYKKLQEVFPESDELKKLLQKIERKLKHAHTDERGTYIQKAKEKIRVLMKEDHFEEALHAAEELHAYAPYDRSLSRLLTRVEKRRDRSLERAMDEFFKEHTSSMLEAFKKDSSQFICV